MNKNKLTPIIGLEIHFEPKTKSKMFCGCKNNPFGAQKPNTYTCPTCLGLPGALPIPNKQAIDYTLKLGLALNCQINFHSYFDRKHYFYPDLPKGYQISQYLKPFCYSGQFMNHDITRIHLEEDTAKLIHRQNETLIDFNRSGVPLVEIVTEPDFHDSKSVKEFLQLLQKTIRALNISDCDMEKGTMRLEANISLSTNPKKLPSYKVELKNINSFRFIKQAIDYEINRQTKLLSQGKIPTQETRGYNSKTKKTFSQRIKETAADYRYFPEPDIPPFEFTKNYLNQIKKTITSSLPEAQIDLLIKKYKLPKPDAIFIQSNPKLHQYFLNHANKNPQQLAKLIINKKVTSKTSSVQLNKLLTKSDDHQTKNEQILTSVIKTIIKNHPKAVKDQAFQFLIGQCQYELKKQEHQPAHIPTLIQLLKASF